MALTGYAEDLNAINKYFLSFTPSKLPPGALNLQNDWKAWYSTLGWWDMNMNKSNWLTGRSKRNAFNVAMGTTLPIDAQTSETMHPNGLPGADIAAAGTSAAQVAPDIAKAMLEITKPLIYVAGGVMALQLLMSMNKKT